MNIFRVKGRHTWNKKSLIRKGDQNSIPTEQEIWSCFRYFTIELDGNNDDDGDQWW